VLLSYEAVEGVPVPRSALQRRDVLITSMKLRCLQVHVVNIECNCGEGCGAVNMAGTSGVRALA